MEVTPITVFRAALQDQNPIKIIEQAMPQAYKNYALANDDSDVKQHAYEAILQILEDRSINLITALRDAFDSSEPISKALMDRATEILNNEVIIKH